MDNGASSYRRFLDGEEDAFREIVDAYFQGLVFFLDRFVHDYALAEDLAIDAFSDLVVHRHRYNFKVTLKTYLYMVGRSRALSALRKKGKRQMLPLSEGESLSDSAPSPEDALLADERKREVNRAIEKLPEEMRAAIHLIYFEEMTYDQASRVMKKTRKQVDNLLYRAKKELRAILGEDGDLLK